MKIGQLYETNQVDAVIRTGARPAREMPGNKQNVGSQAPAADTDRVEVSDAAREAAARGEEFDLGKVTALQKAIAEGRFPVNAEKIADAMISQAAELLHNLSGAPQAEHPEKAE